MSFTDNFITHTLRGIHYINLGDYETAERELKTALEIFDNNEVAHNFLGEIYFKKNDKSEASKYYNETIRINRVYKEIYYFVAYKAKFSFTKNFLYTNKFHLFPHNSSTHYICVS